MKNDKTLESFADYCRDHGVNLLKDDINFIQKALRIYSAKDHRKILSAYYKKWANCQGSENEKRRAANLWLLQYLN